MMRYVVVLICAAMLLTGCRGGAKREAKEREAKSYRFAWVAPPAGVTDSARLSYMREHYWDRFDFADTLTTVKADTTEMLRVFATYVSEYVGATNQEPIRALMRRASASRPMFDYFVMLADKVLYDPNSPLRSDELYIAVLEAQVATPLYDKYERMAPEYTLHLVSQNRVGHTANDFRYTLSSGKSGYLHAIKSDFTIIYINNPDCPMCRDITAQLVASPVISEAERSGRLKILAIYPDRDLDAWHKNLPKYPKSWINAYDMDCVIERQRLYDLKAIPSLYLLDGAKRVLVKDSVNVGELEYMLTRKMEEKR
jgi:hypothetical protein